MRTWARRGSMRLAARARTTSENALNGVGVFKRSEVLDYGRRLALRHPSSALPVGLVGSTRSSGP